MLDDVDLGPKYIELPETEERIERLVYIPREDRAAQTALDAVDAVVECLADPRCVVCTKDIHPIMNAYIREYLLGAVKDGYIALVEHGKQELLRKADV